MSQAWWVSATTFAAVLLVQSPAVAQPDFDFGGNVADEAFTVEGTEATPGGGAGVEPGAATPATGLSFVFTRVPACTGNTPSTEGADAFCPEADALCDVAEEVMYWLYSSPDQMPRVWTFVGQRCQGPETSEEFQSEFPGFTQADFQRLPLPAGNPNIEPDNGYTLINVPTNVYADADAVTLDTDLLGFPVQVRATPSRYAWDFGDGSGHGPTDQAGAPYPDLTITHEYASAGAFPITLTTYYSGEYSVAGGPWLPIAGEAQVQSSPVTVEALSGRNQLVAGSADR